MSATAADEEIKQQARTNLAKTTDPLEKLRLGCILRGGKGIKSLCRKFKILDDNRTGRIELEEFVKGCHENELDNLSDDELRTLFAQFDNDGNGSIDIDEFLLELQPKMSDHRKDLVNKAFDKMDKTGDGVINVNDLKGVYDVSHHPKFQNGDWTEKRCLEEFLTSFDTKGHEDGKVTKTEFHSYYAAISSSIDKDAYFDLMMRQSWGI